MVQTDTSLMQSANNEIARYMHNQIGLWYISSQLRLLAQHIKSLVQCSTKCHVSLSFCGSDVNSCLFHALSK